MATYLVLFTAITFSIMCISYKAFAIQKRWAIGKILSKDASFPIIAAIATGLWALYKSFVYFEWWTPFAILILAWITSFLLTILFKKHTQILCILGIIPALIAVALI
ncbi:hypothetical protein ACFL3C_00245 [Patescibacteria group bacterium]